MKTTKSGKVILSERENTLRQKDEAERAEAYAKKQRHQYLIRFGTLVPFLISCAKYLVLARAVLAVFFTGYIMWQKDKECVKCGLTILPCELPTTGAN